MTMINKTRPPLQPLPAREASRANLDYLNRLRSGEARLTKSSGTEDQIPGWYKEASVFSQIIPPRQVDPNDCEVGEELDELRLRIHDIPTTSAGRGDFMAMSRDVRTPYLHRFWATFQKMQTPVYEFNEYVMMAYRFPVAKQIEDQIGIDMAEARDHILHLSLNDMLQTQRGTWNNVFKGTNVSASVGGAGAANRVLIDKRDILNLKTYYTGRRSQIKFILIPEQNYLQIEAFDLSDMGDQLTGEVLVDGYRRNQLLGVEFLRTIKTDSIHGDVFRADNIYGFADGDHIGRQYDLQGIKQDVESEQHLVRLSARMAFGHIWFGAAYINKCELYQSGKDVAGGKLEGNADGSTPAMGKSDALWEDPDTVMERDFHRIRDGAAYPTLIL